MSTASDLAARELRACRHALEREAPLMPIGNVVHFTPPCVTEPRQIDRLVATARSGIEVATCD